MTLIDIHEDCGEPEDAVEKVLLDAENGDKILSASQKKRSDYEAFGSWLAQNRDSISGPSTETSASLSVEDKTTANMFRDFEKTKIIESPRDYQVELFEKAKEKNIIAVLDTGSGKTLIAALLLRHTIEQELEARAQQKPCRSSFFVVDKVALVFQQHAVLECNLSQSVAKFSGDNTDLRGSSRAFWDDILRDNMVVVCTADILLRCLHHSYVRMDQINLLIFDEAHHTKKNHAYARIIKDFYSREAPANRPRIFGMTASPVDARTNVAQAAQELEALLHSEIATVAQDEMLRSVVKPKKEWVLFYHMAVRPPCTELMEQLRQLVGGHRLFARNFQFASEALSILGPWMVDRFWQLIFRTEELAKHEAKADMDGPQRDVSATPAPLVDDEPIQYSTGVLAVQSASRLVLQHPFTAPSIALLSNKVKRLHETLLDEFKSQGPSQTRCIVFVDQRYTAILLADLLGQEPMRVPHLLPGVLIGGSSTDMGRNSLRTQLLSISKFKQGLINCLFATSIAEEGLDIPDCNLVIRFDLYHTMIQYIQSRGRARHQDSVYVHMAEYGNLEHGRLLSENKASENKMRDFCQALPDDRRLEGNDFDMDYFLRHEAGQQVYVVPSTKAKLTYRSSLVVLAQYVASLPYPSEGSLQADYAVFHTAKGFVCEISLPSSSPVRHATGRPQARKQIAKCAAAFAMCLKLHEKKYIDQHLQPVFASRLPVMRNARLAISSKKQEQYKMRTKPELWSVLGTPAQLFGIVLRLQTPEALSRPSRPLVLLTRHRIPYIPAISLFFGIDRKSAVECVPLDLPLDPTEAELDALATYTLRIFHDVFSKQYKGTAADFPYLVAPCIERRHDFAVGDGASARSMVDWQDMERVGQAARVAYTGDEPDAFFEDRFLSDPFDGSRKFFMRRVRRDLKQTDPEPDGVPLPRNRMRNQPTTERTILNYSVSLWSKSRSRVAFREDQPVVEADIVNHRRNLLDDRVHMDDPQQQTCFLVLETLSISMLPVDVVAMAYAFPPIIYRLEATLVAMEAVAKLDLTGIRPELALEAMTKDCDNSDEPDQSPANFQAGMGKNYERLELLGDSFLKMATSISLYTLVPDKDEFEYHVQRMCMICNRNLFNNALDRQLQEHIRSREFDRSWYPPTVDKAAADGHGHGHGLVLLRGKRTQPSGEHALGDKTIADVCEAMIGAAYLSTYADHDMDLAVRTVSAVVKNKNHAMQAYGDYYAAHVAPDWQTPPPTAAQTQMARTLGQQLGYVFRQPRLLRSAFTHPSYPRIYEGLPSYQRLEFLGDALLDMAIVDYLFHRHPDKDPQWLTEHKMAMVSNQFLAALSVTLGFHRHLLSFSGALQKQVLEYVARVEEERATADNSQDWWVRVTRPPKALADVLEAYVGACFVDAAYDYERSVVPFFQTHIQPFFADMQLYDTFANRHPVTFAVSLLSRRFGCRDWRVVVQETPETAGDGCVTFATKVAAGFLVHGQVVGHGVAESGRYAKIAAAKRAQARLESLALADFQALTGCNCREEEGEADEVDVADEVSTAV